MRIGWRSSAPDEVTELGADGNPVPSSLTPEQDLALRTASLGTCEYCGGPLTEIWNAGYSTSASISYNGTSETVPGDGGWGRTSPPAGRGESWYFCSRKHMDAFLAQRPDRPPRAVTAAELIDMLRMFSGALPVIALYDCRCAGGNVVSVEIGPGPDDPRESVVLIVE